MNTFTALLFTLHYDIFTALVNLTTSFRFYSLNQSSLLYVILIFLPTPHFPSLHLYHLYFAALVISFRTLFLKLCILPVREPISLSDSWFQSVMVLFTKENFPTYLLCFPALIFQLTHNHGKNYFKLIMERKHHYIKMHGIKRQNSSVSSIYL
jgi:hypothetical protein